MIGLKLDVAGAAQATVISQYISGVCIAIYSLICVPYLKIKIKEIRIRWSFKIDAFLADITGFLYYFAMQKRRKA